jgi:hypothetical protein
MTEREEPPFLSRWSSRKIAAKDAQETAATEAAAQACVPVSDGQPVSAGREADAPTAAAPVVPLPPVDSLRGIASEYHEFLKPGVDEALKRAALKKLFNDPHFGFAAMDKLDIYIDDYSIEDPIPEALLRKLNQSKSLFLFEEKKAEGTDPDPLIVDALPQPAAVPADDGAPASLSPLSPMSPMSPISPMALDPAQSLTPVTLKPEATKRG